MSPTVLCDTIHLLLSGDKASNNLCSTPNKCFQFNDLRNSAHYWLTLLLFPINLRKRWVNNYFTGFYQSPETALLQPNGSFCLGLWEKNMCIFGKNKVSKKILLLNNQAWIKLPNFPLLLTEAVTLDMKKF